MRRLILIKHSHPIVEPGVPPERWQLSDRGRQRAERLAVAVAEMGAKSLYSSDEPKAVQTAEAIAGATGLTNCPDSGFKEHVRTDAPYFESVEDFRAAVIDAMRRPSDLVFGSETTGAALSRFTGAVERACAEAPPGDITIVAHGTVIAMFIASRTGLDPVPLWESLGLPGMAAIAWPEASGIESQRNFE
jgi:broad specificity phosphatase PhoE